jgi:hypothetical protein
VTARRYLSFAPLLLVLLSARPVSGQAVTSFDDWMGVCQATDGCAGHVTGPDAAFYLIDDGTTCPVGKCLRATWSASGDHLSVHAPPFMPQPDTLHAQARFRASGALWDQLNSPDVATQIPLLRLVTSDANTWAQVVLAGSPPRLEVSALREGTPAGSFTPRALSLDPDLWVTVELGVDGRSGEGVLYFYFDGVRREERIALPTRPATVFTEAYALGVADFGDLAGASPPAVEIDEFCVADDRAAALAGCPTGMMIPRDAGVDTGVDATVPGDATVDAAAADARPTRDGRTSDFDAAGAGASFRGSGGCACRTTSARRADGVLIAMVLAGLCRRRRR